MFEQVSATLDDAIEALDIPVDEAALVRCFGLLDRFSARVTAAVGEFDKAGAWRDCGATSMAGWLRHRTHCSQRDAGRWARTARRLADLPVTSQAYSEGALSSGQVQAIVANLNNDTTPLFAAAEPELVAKLAGMRLRDVSTLMQSWAAAAKDHLQPDPSEEGEPEATGPERSLHLSETLDGRGEMTASLDPEGRALAETAIRLAETPDTEAEPPRTPARRRADAFVDICRFFLDHQHTHKGGRHRPHLNIILDYENLTGEHPCPHSGPSSTTAADGPQPAQPHSGGGRLLDGTTLDAATIHRLACDAGIHRVVMAGRSSILDYGYTTRTIPANLWAALVARDRHCRFPGCDRPPQWCEAHHVQPWEHGGPTCIGNLILGCSRHHHILHTPGWHAKLLPDGTVHITDPKGRVHTTHPPGQLPHLFDPP